MLIDTWLLAVFFLALLLLLALVRFIRIRQLYDRVAAAVVALCLISAAGLLLSIALGTFLLLNLTIVAVLVCFALLAVQVRSGRGEQT